MTPETKQTMEVTPASEPLTRTPALSQDSVASLEQDHHSCFSIFHFYSVAVSITALTEILSQKHNGIFMGKYS